MSIIYKFLIEKQDMVIFSNKMESLLVYLLLNITLPLAREVTIYPEGETDPDF